MKRSTFKNRLLCLVPYPENAFDIVFSNNHLWSDEKIGVYRKVYDAIEPDGCYIESDFTMDGNGAILEARK